VYILDLGDIFGVGVGVGVVTRIFFFPAGAAVPPRRRARYSTSRGAAPA